MRFILAISGGAVKIMRTFVHLTGDREPNEPGLQAQLLAAAAVVWPQAVRSTFSTRVAMKDPVTARIRKRTAHGGQDSGRLRNSRRSDCRRCCQQTRAHEKRVRESE